jgi:hypothetical protein
MIVFTVGTFVGTATEIRRISPHAQASVGKGLSFEFSVT